jgi:hypothetical protein
MTTTSAIGCQITSNRRQLLLLSLFGITSFNLSGCDKSPTASPSKQLAMAKTLARKAASEQRLTKLGVTINPDLPTLHIDWLGVKISAQDAAKRLIVMRHLAGAATVEIDIKKLVTWLKDQKLYDSLSFKEAKYLNDWHISNHWQQNFNISWRYEAAWFIAWALGLFPLLSPPFEQIGTEAEAVWGKIPFAFDNESCTEFISKAQFIADERIMDELDFTYRAYWATQNLRIDKGTKIGKLNGEILIERLYAGNWLMENNIDWDKVNTNT